MRFRRRPTEPLVIDTRMVRFMTRVMLTDCGGGEKWLLWLGTPLELDMTHEAWQAAEKAYGVADSLQFIMTGKRPMAESRQR